MIHNKRITPVRLTKTVATAMLLVVLFGVFGYVCSQEYWQAGIVVAVITGLVSPWPLWGYFGRHRIFVMSSDVPAFEAGRRPPREDE